MEKNLLDAIQKYIKQDPYNMNRLKAMMDYRALRMEQAVLSTYANEYKYKQWNSKFKEVRNAGEFDHSWWQYRIQVLDVKRRDVHNDALLSMIRLLEFGDKNNLPSLYGGRRLEIADVLHYNTSKHDIRKEMTTGMFELLYNIQSSILKENQKQSEVADIKQGLERDCDQYNVKTPILRDESDHNKRNPGDLDGIEFRFEQLFTSNISENI